MHSSTIVLAVGLLASPLALLANPSDTPATAGLTQLTQYSATAPDRSINGRPLVDAPVPDSLPTGVPPEDRAAGPGSRDLSAGPINATPFSAAPISNVASGSPGWSNGTDSDVATPALGK